MTLRQRLPLLLFEPDYATFDLFESPHLKDAFLVVTAYGFLASVNAFLTSATVAGSTFRFIIFFFSFFLVYATWIFLTVAFHGLSSFLGGKGEIVNALGFVGFAAAPNALLAAVAILMTIVWPMFMPHDPDLILKKIQVGISLIGMVWGWPGVLCYFGLKNAERLRDIKALLVTLPLFFLFAGLEVYLSSVF